jgi:uncharacterized repeat protein (TIGR03803 family)
MFKLADQITWMLCSLVLSAAVPTAASAAGTKVIYNFTGGSDGATPLSPLTPDGFGNVYGMTQQGGGVASCPLLDGCGTIFKIDRAGNLTTLHAFASGTDGQTPQQGVGLTLIGHVLYGNVPGGSSGESYSEFFSIHPDGSDYQIRYGTTLAQCEELVGVLQPAPGGLAFGVCGPGGGKFGRGTLIHLGAAKGLTVIHEFAGGTDGDDPTYLIQDSLHKLFGSTYSGGQCATFTKGCGTVFEYDPTTNAYTVLYAFQNGTDGYAPLIGAVGSDGTLYGVTQFGGAEHHGALFALTPNGTGYSFSVLSPVISDLHGDGARNPPALSPDGALVGGTAFGGTYVYQSGRYAISYSNAYPEPDGQFLIPSTHPGAILATSQQNGTSSACMLSGGCGFIYYQQQ